MDYKEIDLDSIITEIGEFGKYQIINYILICFPVFLSACYSLSYVFTAGNLDYRCKIPECEENPLDYDGGEWIKNGIPYENSQILQKCIHYKLNDTILWSNSSSTEQNDCPAEYFDRTTEIQCTEFVYRNDERTILNEFNITCENNEWQLTLIGSINNIAQFVATPVVGYVSDRYGRRTVLIWGILFSGLFGLIRSFSINYAMFVTLEFLDACACAGVYSAVFILGMEMLGPSKRVLGGTIIAGAYSIGVAFLGAVAMVTEDFRLLLRIIYIPTIFMISYFWLLPESMRWLLIKNKLDKVIEIIHRAAKINKVILSDSVLMILKQNTSNTNATNNNNNNNNIEDFVDANDDDDYEDPVHIDKINNNIIISNLKYEKNSNTIISDIDEDIHRINVNPNTINNNSNNNLNSESESGHAKETIQLQTVGKNEKKTSSQNYPLMSIFKSNFLLLRLLNCSFCWITNTFVYYGLSLNSVLLAGNKYINFILVGLIEIPAFLLTFYLMDKIGRRWTLFGALIGSGIACVVTEFLPYDQTTLRLVLFLIGKCAITISFTNIYIYTTELYPTNLRHTLMSVCSTLGRIGSILAPQTILLAHYNESLPLYLFAGVAITSGILILNFPETLNTKLPDTVEEAINIGKKNNSNNNINTNVNKNIDKS